MVARAEIKVLGSYEAVELYPEDDEPDCEPGAHQPYCRQFAGSLIQQRDYWRNRLCKAEAEWNCVRPKDHDPVTGGETK